MVSSEMRLSWWLGRCRRYGPTVVIILSVVFVCWRIASQPVTDNFPGSVRVEPNPITDEDKVVLDGQDPPPPTPPNWWMIAWNNKFSCSQLAAALTKRWTVLLANDALSTKYSHSRCMFMNYTSLDDMSAELKSHMLQDMYKAAIKMGAEAIYVIADWTTLDDIRMIDSQLVDSKIRHYLSIVQNQLHDVAHLSTKSHFGCASNNGNGDNANSVFTYSLCSAERLAILSPLALYEDRTNDQIQCDKFAPAIMATGHTYVEMTLFGSVFFRNAFWALPIDAEFERARWHLVVQHSLRTVLGNVAVFHGKDDLDNGPIISDRSFEAAMLQTLDSVQCLQTSVYSCVTSVLEQLRQWKVLSERSTVQLKQWFDTLQTVLAAPKIELNYAEQPLDCLPNSVQFHSSQFNARNTLAHDASRNVQHSATLVQNLCSPLLSESTIRTMIGTLRKSWKRLDGTLLVIVFNNAHYEAIAYIEALYRSFFPHILYCGPGSPPQSNYQFSFASYVGTPAGHSNGSLNYECALLAYSMYPHMPGGYLFSADDILLLLHKVADLPSEETWFIPREEVRVGEIRRNRECRLGMCDFYTRWPWWLDYQNATITALLGIRQRAINSLLFNRCYRRLIDSNGALLRANGGYADIYHIPQRQMADFVQLAAYFLEHRVFLEIAIPTIIRCLESDANVSPLVGIQSWDADYRDSPWHYFRQAELVGKTYFHPTKWGFIERGSKNHTIFFCKALEFLGDKYGRMT